MIDIQFFRYHSPIGDFRIHDRISMTHIPRIGESVSIYTENESLVCRVVDVMYALDDRTVIDVYLTEGEPLLGYGRNISKYLK